MKTLKQLLDKHGVHIYENDEDALINVEAEYKNQFTPPPSGQQPDDDEGDLYDAVIQYRKDHPEKSQQPVKLWREVPVSERNPNPVVIDTYHTNIRMIGTNESTFPSGTTFSGEWEVSEGYEVISYLEPYTPTVEHA